MAMPAGQAKSPGRASTTGSWRARTYEVRSRNDRTQLPRPHPFTRARWYGRYSMPPVLGQTSVVVDEKDVHQVDIFPQSRGKAPRSRRREQAVLCDPRTLPLAICSARSIPSAAGRHYPETHIVHDQPVPAVNRQTGLASRSDSNGMQPCAASSADTDTESDFRAG
jgi:hypothetical protein